MHSLISSNTHNCQHIISDVRFLNGNIGFLGIRELFIKIYEALTFVLIKCYRGT